jgi:hypothetical protein
LTLAWLSSWVSSGAARSYSGSTPSSLSRAANRSARRSAASARWWTASARLSAAWARLAFGRSELRLLYDGPTLGLGDSGLFLGTHPFFVGASTLLICSPLFGLALLVQLVKCSLTQTRRVVDSLGVGTRSRAPPRSAQSINNSASSASCVIAMDTKPSAEVENTHFAVSSRSMPNDKRTRRPSILLGHLRHLRHSSFQRSRVGCAVT